MTYIINHIFFDMVDLTLLVKYGAVKKKLIPGQVLFRENETAFFYYQIVEGKIKMNNYNDDGAELIQGIFEGSKSFGEPPLFGNFKYPANAVALTKTEIIALEKTLFFKMLKKNYNLSLYFLAVLSKRIRYKAILSKEVKGFDAPHKIETLLNLLKTQKTVEEIKATRQTIASLTGLRVETVIKTIKNLEKLGKLKIKNRKIFM